MISSRKLKKIRKAKLPEQILVFENQDKASFKETWTKDRSLMNPPKPYKIIVVGRTSCGKTSLIKNFIVRADFEEIIIYHFSGHDTMEYKDVGGVMVAEMPNSHAFPNDGKKRLLILEDLDMKSMKKQELHDMEKLYSYCSSHKNLSIILTAQDPIQGVPVFARRMSNIFILFRIPDLNCLSIMSSRVGISKKDFMHIFKKYIKSRHDFLMIDLTHPKHTLRINAFNPIEI